MKGYCRLGITCDGFIFAIIRDRTDTRIQNNRVLYLAAPGFNNRKIANEKIIQYSVYKTGNKPYKLSNKVKGTILGSVYLFTSYITLLLG